MARAGRANNIYQCSDANGRALSLDQAKKQPSKSEAADVKRYI